MATDEFAWNIGKSSTKVEKCLLGKEELALPENLIEKGAIFQEVVSQKTWDRVLSESQKSHLMTFLPSFPENDIQEKETCVRNLFSGENFKFGNPLKHFHRRIRDGYYSPDIAKYSDLCRKVKYQEYKHRQQCYYSELLKEIVLSRQQALEDMCHLGPDEPVKFNYTPKVTNNLPIESKVKKKYAKILREVREECGCEDTSSEDDDVPNPALLSKKQLFKALYPIPSPEPTIPNVVATYAAKPAINGDSMGEVTNSKRGRPISPVEIFDEDYQNLLTQHKKKRLEDEDLPELDVSNITLQDIMTRCQAIRKVTKSPASPSQSSHSAPAMKKKSKNKERQEKRLKKNKLSSSRLHKEKVDNPGSASPEMGAEDSNVEVVLDHEPTLPSDFSSHETRHLLKAPSCEHDCFFSLIRDLICEFPEERVTTSKLEEKVREWQDSHNSSLNSWYQKQLNWIDCVLSALKYLSGDILGLSVIEFIPYLDYKERAQQWKWIGLGRDGDDKLTTLCTHWLENKDDSFLDTIDNREGSPPPPRCSTTFVVRATTEDEKESFRNQEMIRFDDPHKAFTYKIHGYECVVGPVKGVYSKENAMNKAREHALLISDRPAYVTILTLVRDAAARLPNGEGTRSDICELLKDSHFLAPGVTDAQINTVVSGALDRLHYEKDPCVKYDVNRKLWIYLHRSRAEEEFERIHQAQGLAVKAKKSLQKPKLAKTPKNKETVIPASVSPRPPSSPSIHSSDSINVEDTSLHIQSSPVPSQSPKASTQSPRLLHTSPRNTQSSPKTGAPTARQLLSSICSGHVANSLDQSLGNPAISTIGQPQASPHVMTSSPVFNQPTAAATPPHTPHVISGKPLTFAVIPQGTGSPIPGQIQTTPTGSKPMSFSLIQAQNNVHKAGLSAANNIVGSPRASHTVVITTKPDATIQRQLSASSAPSVASVLSTQHKHIRHGHPAFLSQGKPSAPAASSAAPMVARLIQQVPGHHAHMVSVSNLLAGTALQKIGMAPPGTPTIKIQGSNIMQTVGGGKPIHLTGKPLQAAKGMVQLTGKPQHSLGMIQTPQGTINLISHGGTPTSVSQTQQKPASTAGTVLSSTLQPTSQTKSMMNSSASSSALLTPQTVQVVSHTKVGSPSQGSIVVTQLTPGGLQLRAGVSPGQAKMMSAGQAGLVPAQFIMQQTPSGIKAAGSEVNSCGGTSSSQVNQPIFVSSTGGKPGQNIQVVRTLLSQQAGMKPGQATILISNPALQQSQGGSMLSPAQFIQSATTKATTKGTGKGKAQAVFARIITPPPSMKMGNLPPGHQMHNAGQGVVHLVNKQTTSATIASLQQQMAAKMADRDGTEQS